MLKIATTFISYYRVTSIIILLILIALVTLFEMIVRDRRTNKLKRLDPFLDWMPFMVGLVPLTGLFTAIIYLFRTVTVPHTGTGDPKVISAGLAKYYYMNIAILCGLFFILLGASFVLRMLYGRYIRKLGAGV
jgi:hypothetical protein